MSKDDLAEAITEAEAAGAQRAIHIDGAALVYYAIMALVYAVLDVSDAIRTSDGGK